uniref:histidine kinase n=1 Tax=Solibacter usitatus (strain Ellin6076) TaxID=234267 RepID=Q027F8_SOLUE
METPVDHILDNLRDAVIMLDDAGRVAYLNRAAAEVFGRPAAELVGRPLREIFPQCPGNHLCDELHRAVSDRRSGHFEGYCATLDRWLEADVHPSPNHLLIITRDVTAVRKCERDSEDRLRMALSCGLAAVWECDLATLVVRCSSELDVVHGMPPGSLDGKHADLMFSLIHPEDQDAVSLSFKEALQQRGTFSHEFRVIWPDGSVRFLFCRARILCGSAGSPGSMLGVSVDVTGQKYTAGQLERKLQQMHMLSGLAETVNRAQDPAEIYLAALKGLTNAVGSDRAAVLVFDADGVMRFKAWAGLSDEYRAAATGHSPWRRGERGALPIKIPDVFEDPALATLYPALRNEGIRSVAFIPLLGHGGVIGKFMLYFDRPHQFREEELQLAQTIAAQVAFAVERSAAEVALQSSEERFRATFFQAAVGITQAQLSGRLQLVNDRFCEILGYSREELLDLTFLDLTHPDDREACAHYIHQLVVGEIASCTTEKRYLHKSGATVWARVNVSLVRDQNQAAQYFIGVVEDITQWIQASRALMESEQRLTLAVNAARLGVWDFDLREKVMTVSPPYGELLGSPGTYADCLALVHPDDRERVLTLARECVAGKQGLDAEYRMLLPDGTLLWLSSNAAVQYDDAGNPARVVGVSLDITARKQAEAALRESEELFRNLADTAPVMMWMSGPDKRLNFFNKTWLTFRGRTVEQELGDGWVEGIHPDDVASVFASYSSAFDARRNFDIECRLRRADGEYRWLLCSGVPRFAPSGVFAGYIGSDVDITDLKRTQAEAIERQKLESLRVLTNGIAHDFNNLLGSVVSVAELAELEMLAGASPQEQIERIKFLAVRASEIVRELMIFSGQDQADLTSLDLSSLAEEMLELLKVSISKHAVLKTDLPRNLPPMRGNAAQIRQVLMNLIINASEALGESDGMIRIAVSRAAPSRSLPGGAFLRLEVSDTGCGISEESQARIFDPFFSTKFAGRGLGLAVVQGIVRAHAGAIQLSSAPGNGARFEIFFPCAPAGVEPHHAPAIADANREARPVDAILLFVDDEESLRESVSKLLSRRGFSVLSAGDGCAAVDLLQRHPEKIDLLLLDMTLPGTPSREIIAEAQRVRPSIKIILTSAYSREMVAHSLDSPAVRGFIRKPFQLADLVLLLRDTIAAV